MTKILTVIGARPQFVKAAVLSREFSNCPGINEVIVHTGQHFDSNMSAIFFEEMGLAIPHYTLTVNNAGHGAMTGKMLEKIEEIIVEEKPDALMVYGDTNSTLAGALAAVKLHVPVIHVEAGLRSFNMKMPEEINRIITDRISSLLFCPTNIAMTNLEKEGFKKMGIRYFKVGDVMEDAALFYSGFSSKKSNIISKLNMHNKPFILCTVHRAENTDNLNNFNSIIEALDELSKEIPVILPLHPRTRNILNVNDIKPSFTTIDPVGYFDMIELIKNSKLVMTDSGGLQKEAFFFNKYCVTLREETEWMELVDNGYNFLAGTNKKRILELSRKFLNRPFLAKQNLYGNGQACKNIVDKILYYFNK